MRILLTPLIIFAIIFIGLADNSPVYPLISIIMFILSIMINRKYPKSHHFDSTLDRVPFGKYKGKTIEWILTNDIEYYDWLSKQPNVHMALCIQRAYNNWSYIAG